MNKFDKIIWRINGIIILGVGILASITLLFTSYHIFKDTTRDRKVNKIVNINSETKKKEYLSLGSFEKIKGKDWLYSPLIGNQEYDRSYYSKSTSSIRNYLFFDTNTTSSHWLVDSHDWLITRTNRIYEKINDDCKSSNIKGFTYEIIKYDSNNDKLLNYDDHTSVYISDYSGKNFKMIVENAKNILGITQNDDSSIIVFFLKDSKSIANIVNVDTGETIESTVLPIKS